MATNYLLHYRHTRASSNAHKDKISKLETPSTTRLQPRPSGSISPIYRDNLFTIDPPSCTRIPPSLNTSTGGKERFLQTSRPSVQYSNQLASTSGSNPRTGGGGGSSKRTSVLEDRWKITSSTSGGEERGLGKLDLSVLDNLVTFTAPTVNHARLIRGHHSRRSI